MKEFNVTPTHIEVPGTIDGPVDIPGVPCPGCSKVDTLRVEPKLKVTGLAPVAGVMTKASAVTTVYLVCTSCDFIKEGKR